MKGEGHGKKADIHHEVVAAPDKERVRPKGPFIFKLPHGLDPLQHASEKLAEFGIERAGLNALSEEEGSEGGCEEEVADNRTPGESRFFGAAIGILLRDVDQGT